MKKNVLTMVVLGIAAFITVYIGADFIYYASIYYGIFNTHEDTTTFMFEYHIIDWLGQVLTSWTGWAMVIGTPFTYGCILGSEICKMTNKNKD